MGSQLNLRNLAFLGILTPPPFDPKNISNQLAWYDASNAAYVTRTDENVTNLSDVFDGSNKQIGQGNGANKPHWFADQQNGLPTILFDTTDDLSKNNWGSGPSSQPTTIFIVCVMPTAVTSGVFAPIFDSRTTAASACRFGREDIGEPNGIEINAGVKLVDNDETISSDFEVYTLVFDGMSSSISIGGVEIAAGDAGTGEIGGFVLNQNEAANWKSNIEFAEVIMYNKLLTAQETSDVEAYLIDKWGL
jgi:hypothetical protein